MQAVRERSVFVTEIPPRTSAMLPAVIAPPTPPVLVPPPPKPSSLELLERSSRVLNRHMAVLGAGAGIAWLGVAGLGLGGLHLYQALANAHVIPYSSMWEGIVAIGGTVTGVALPFAISKVYDLKYRRIMKDYAVAVEAENAVRRAAYAAANPGNTD